MTPESAGLRSEDRMVGLLVFCGQLVGWVKVTFRKVGANGTMMSPYPKVEPRPPPVPSTQPQPYDPGRLLVGGRGTPDVPLSFLLGPLSWMMG